MKAAVCREFEKPLSVENISLAKPGPGEVKVRLRACAICHSDIVYMDGGWGGTLPAVYGHEAAGVVAAIGSGAQGLTVGDHVVVTLIRYCGDCHYCAQGHQVMCERSFPLDEASPLTAAGGEQLQQGLRTGAFAEEVVVHASQVCTIPKTIPFESASLLACGVLTGFCAVTNTVQVPVGSNVVIIGAGGVGLNTLQGAVLAGAATVVAVDIAESKLDAARQFGATHTFNSTTSDVRQGCLDITAGRGADFVFVTVGAKAAIDQSVALLGRGGTVVVVGMPVSGVLAEYDPGTLASMSQKIVGSKMGSARVAEDIPKLVALYEQGHLKLDELVSGRYPLDDINLAIASVKRGEALRHVIVF